MNPFQFGVYALGAACCWWGSLLARKFPRQWWMAVPLLGLAVPCVVYVLYYAHLWDEPIWLYQLRSVPGTELLAALGGLLVGWCHWHLPKRFAGSLGFVSCFFVLWLSIPGRDTTHPGNGHIDSTTLKLRWVRRRRRRRSSHCWSRW